MAVLCEDQAMLRDAARGWVDETHPIGRMRALRDARSSIGYDAEAYRAMAQMGWSGVIVPEAQGGAGFGYLSAGLILEALGRQLAPSPLVGSAIAAATALAGSANPALGAEWLPSIASGDAVIALAIDEGPRHAPLDTALAAVRDGGGWTLTGTKRNVVDGMAADALLVAVRTHGEPGQAEGVGLVLVPADAPGIARTAQRQIDGSVAATVTLDGVGVTADALLGDFALLDLTLDAARAGTASEMLGAAEQAFAITLDYLKVRVQFSQLIGSFQALQHRAADLLAELVLTRSAVEKALAALDLGSDDRAPLASLAKLFASQTFHRVSNEMIQMHGGIGMTQEHDAGLYLRRARVAAFAYGGEAFHRERYGQLTGH